MEWIRDLSIFFQVVLYIAGSLVALSGAIAVIVKFWKWIRKPNEETSAALDEYKIEDGEDFQRLQESIAVNQKAIENINEKMEKEHEAVFTILERDKERMDQYDANFRVLYRGMLALLDQQLNPNGNMAQMQKARDELNSHIIDS